MGGVCVKDGRLEVEHQSTMEIETTSSQTGSHSKLDLDSNGKVNAAELRQFVQQDHMGFTTEQVDAMFSVWDKDGSGSIDATEFGEVLEVAELSQSNVSVSIIVPSTVNVEVKCTEQDLHNRRGKVMAFLTSRFGGATARAEHLGAYEAFDGSIVYESGVDVYTFTTPQKWKDNAQSVRTRVEHWCDEWEQECIALIVNGTMEFVMPPGKTDPQTLCQSSPIRAQRLMEWRRVKTMRGKGRLGTMRKGEVDI